MEHQFTAGADTQYTNDCANQVVAMAYVPWQNLNTVYEPDDAFQVGTIFPELNKPFMVGGGGCER